MSKITYNNYTSLVRDPNISEGTIASLTRIKKGTGGFDFYLTPDPEKVALRFEDLEFENAMGIGNTISRFRRQASFRRRKLLGSKLPVLVAEGDSWFEFPLLVREIVDQLEDDYLIWSIGAAGDTAQNIVYGRAEYPKALQDHRQDVSGFLFSAAGNDIIGEDPNAQEPVLLSLLKNFNGTESDVEGHLNLDLLNQRLSFIEQTYQKVVNDIRGPLGFPYLPIFIHGYDYAIPYLRNSSDQRSPIHADKDQWLGRPLDERGILDPTLRRSIIQYLIDRLHNILSKIAGDSNITRVWLVDCRGAMPDVTDWIDEIHGTSDGFKKVAARFAYAIKSAI